MGCHRRPHRPQPPRSGHGRGVYTLVSSPTRRRRREWWSHSSCSMRLAASLKSSPGEPGTHGQRRAAEHWRQEKEKTVERGAADGQTGPGLRRAVHGWLGDIQGSLGFEPRLRAKPTATPPG